MTDAEIVVRRIVEAIEQAKAERPNLDGYYMGLADAAGIARNAGNAATTILAERASPALLEPPTKITGGWTSGVVQGSK